MYQRASGWTEIGKKRRRAAAKLARDAHLYRVQQGVTANPLLVRVRVTPNQIMRTSTEYNRVRRPTLSPAAAAAAAVAPDVAAAADADADADADAAAAAASKQPMFVSCGRFRRVGGSGGVCVCVVQG